VVGKLGQCCVEAAAIPGGDGVGDRLVHRGLLAEFLTGQVAHGDDEISVLLHLAYMPGAKAAHRKVMAPGGVDRALVDCTPGWEGRKLPGTAGPRRGPCSGWLAEQRRGGVRNHCRSQVHQAGAARAVQVKLPVSGSSLATAWATCRPSASAPLTVSPGSTQPSISTRRVRPVHRARAWAWITPPRPSPARL